MCKGYRQLEVEMALNTSIEILMKITIYKFHLPGCKKKKKSATGEGTLLVDSVKWFSRGPFGNI